MTGHWVEQGSMGKCALWFMKSSCPGISMADRDLHANQRTDLHCARQFKQEMADGFAIACLNECTKGLWASLAVWTANAHENPS